MDTFPDITVMTNQELKDFIGELTRESNLMGGPDDQPLRDGSGDYRRRVALNKRDVVRAELTKRLRGRLGKSGD